MKDRLQKILSKHGYGSRRDCERIIASNRVKINNRFAKLGDSADLEMEQIFVDGKEIKNKPQNEIWIAFNKPVNVLSEIKKTGHRKSVSDYVPTQDYLFIVGRLDFNSEGLLLLTNNGKYANFLTHPRYQHEKEYAVRFIKKPSKSTIIRWKKGVPLPSGYITQPAKVFSLTTMQEDNWLTIILTEGKKRQIRITAGVLGLNVDRIIRKRIATVGLRGLHEGKYRYLSDDEIEGLKNHIDSGLRDQQMF